ncbi:MAG TPA: LLM class F420-dependent oxidoreductase [Streptosporangiaceae bacterium]|jgi:probable F420-dependent oxidoreductase|nr:LLM class F420-dependent oxidoreductase [Streptosporangiaceae bacterium]
MDLGRVGIWDIGLRMEDNVAGGAAAEAAAELEELGYGAIWLGSSPGVEHAVPLLKATSRIVVATGILSIWDYEPADVAARHAAVTAEHPERFLLGLGVSHEVLVKERYQHPMAAMHAFLDGLDDAATPVPATQRVLAALGPRMLETARDRAAGAHPYLVTPEHTRRARRLLGPDRLLAPEVKVVMEADTDRARAVARGHVSGYLGLPNYANNMRRLGYTDADLAEGGSDELVASVVAWGADSISERVAAHEEAGADHVCVQVITDDRTKLPRREWRELAAILRPA